MHICPRFTLAAGNWLVAVTVGGPLSRDGALQPLAAPHVQQPEGVKASHSGHSRHEWRPGPHVPTIAGQPGKRHAKRFS